MECNLREKQLRKKIKKTKKGLTLAATALILNGSLMPINNVFADEQASESETTNSNIETQDDTTRATNGRISINTPIVSNTYLSNGNIQWNNWWIRLQNTRGNGRIVQNNVTTSSGTLVDPTGGIGFAQTYIRKQSNRSILVGSTASSVDPKEAQIRTIFTLPVNRTYQIPVSSNGVAAGVRVQYENQIGTGKRFSTVQLSNSSGTLTLKPTQNLSLAMTYQTTVDANQTSTFTFGNIVMKYASQWNQVDDLFGNQQHTSLASGINGTIIQAAIQMANNLPNSNEDKQDILAEANKAWNLYQIKNTVLNNNLTTDSTNVTGAGEPGGTVIIRKEDGTELGRGTVDSNGHYSVTIPKQGAGTRVKAEVSYNGKTSVSGIVTVSQGVIVQTTINNNLTTDSTNVTGAGEPGGTVIIRKEDGTELGRGTVDSNGHYSVTIPKQGAGTRVKAEVSYNGKTSVSGIVTVSQGVIVQTTINNNLTTDSTNVTGAGEPGGTVIIRKEDGTELGRGTVDSNGHYSVTIPKQGAGTRVKAEVSYNGKTSVSGIVTVKQDALAQTTISNIDTTTTTVTGTGEPNATIQLKVGNKVIAEGKIGSDGKYSLTIKEQAAGKVVQAIVTKDGLISEASTTVIKGALVQTTISNIDTTMTSVSGKAEPNATIQLKVGDKVIAAGKVGSDGLYSLTIPKQSAGTVVQAVATLDGLTSTAETVVVRGELDQTTISAITTETTTVTGTGEPNATIQLKVGDKVIAAGKVGSDGKYSLTIPKQSANSVVVAVVTKDNKTSEASTVVKNTSNATITKVDPYEEGKSNYVTGTYTGTGVSYIRVVVNGEKKTLIPMTGQEAGKFKYYINGLKATDKVEIALYDGSYKELARKNVTVVEHSAVSITKVDTYKEGVSNYVTGTYSGDGVAFMRVVVNGKNQALVPMNGQTQGSFKYYISNLKATDNVRIQLYNRDYTLLAQKQVPIESTANIKITGVEKYIEGKSEYVRGTYDGEGAAYIRLVVNGVNKAMVPMTGQSQGTFSYYVQGLKATDNVKVVLFDAQYRVLGEEKVIVEAPTVSNVTITSVGEYAEGKSEWITGSYEGDNASYVGLIVNGNTEMRVPISDPVAKTFKYYKNGLKATDNVQVVLYNKKSEEVARKQLVITAPAVSNIKITSLSDYKVGKSEWITGSYEGDNASYVGLIVNGNAEMRVPISDSVAKTFKYYKNGLKATDNVQVVLYNKKSEEVARKQLVITAPAV
ncbi:Ig-like domain-containing protein, partial [Enterococcus faecalis]|uniref:Ig-like domain-containing protein n=1 Tax=Enterococcus faecalis TaxID=1351 RepID=UPI0025AF2A61